MHCKSTNHADVASNEPNSPIRDAQLEEKIAAWTQEQLRLAQRAKVPRSELYGCTDAPLYQTGAVDKHYVHTRFALAGLEEVLDASFSSPYWAALRCQLQWDIAQQVRYCEEQQHQQQQRCAKEGDVDRVMQLLSSYTISNLIPALKYVGGVDISFIPNTDDGVACLAILRYPSLELVKTYMHRCTLREPYISTFLAFREVQPVLELFEKVGVELKATQTLPQLLIVDGNGVHHPRRCGLATHLGVALDIPTIGSSKKILKVDGITRESVEATLLMDTSAADATLSTSNSKLPSILPLVGTSSPAQMYGYAVHGHLNSVKKCIVVSPGHCVGFAAATALVATMLRHRIPEPIRAADLGSRELIRDSVASAVTADDRGTKKSS